MDYSIFGPYEREARCCLPVLVEMGKQSINFQKELSRSQIIYKSDKSPVTIFDYIIQAFIVNQILKEFPNDLIVAEESITHKKKQSKNEKVLFEEIKKTIKEINSTAAATAATTTTTLTATSTTSNESNNNNNENNNNNNENNNNKYNSDNNNNNNNDNNDSNNNSNDCSNDNSNNNNNNNDANINNNMNKEKSETGNEKSKWHIDNFEIVMSKVQKRAPAKCERFWAIDPIDGTSGFRRCGGRIRKENGNSCQATNDLAMAEEMKRSQYAIAICLIERNECVFSAVCWPQQIPILTNLPRAELALFFAARGYGAFSITESAVSSGLGRFDRVLVPQNPEMRPILPPNNNMVVQNKLQEIASRLDVKFDPVCCTSMTKGFSLSLGAGCFYIRVPFNKEENVYDIAPFSMFVEESGGFATTGRGEKLVFKNDGFVKGTNVGLLFSNRGKEFHEKLVNLYMEVFEIPATF